MCHFKCCGPKILNKLSLIYGSQAEQAIKQVLSLWYSSSPGSVGAEGVCVVAASCAHSVPLRRWTSTLITFVSDCPETLVCMILLSSTALQSSIFDVIIRHCENMIARAAVHCTLRLLWFISLGLDISSDKITEMHSGVAEVGESCRGGRGTCTSEMGPQTLFPFCIKPHQIFKGVPQGTKPPANHKLSSYAHV